jgi:hypothetical protein
MLSLSAELSEATVNLQMINGDDDATEGDVAHAKALMHFAESFARRDEAALTEARAALLAEAGAEVLVDAAGVAANFQRMVRIADSTGIPLDERNVAISVGVRQELDLQRFPTAMNTPKASLKVKLLSLIARPIAKRMIKKMEAQRIKTKG